MTNPKAQWEVFDPFNGRPLGIFSRQWMARLACWLCPRLDYERTIEGKQW